MGLFDAFKKRLMKNDSKTSDERKKETEKLLKSLHVPYLDHLPVIEEEHEAKIRSKHEIAERIIVLTYLTYISEVPEEKEKVVDFLKTYSLWEKVSPKEQELFQKEACSRQETINMSWRTEAIWLLLWTINKVE